MLCVISCLIRKYKKPGQCKFLDKYNCDCLFETKPNTQENQVSYRAQLISIRSVSDRENRAQPAIIQRISPRNQSIIESHELRESSALRGNLENQSLPITDRALIWEGQKCKEYSIAQQKTCSICLEDFKIGEYLTKTKCDHLFHIACLDEWKNKSKQLTCPVCRKNICRKQ